MMSFSALSGGSDAAGYYQKDNYYTRDQASEASGWLGKGAAALGLKGPVDEATFAAVLDGKLPNGAEIRSPSGQHRAGWDLTFSASKSVSLMALVGGDKRIEEAMRDSVEATLEWAEQHLIEARVADPQHQLGDRCGARVDLDPQEVFRGDGVAGDLGHVLVIAQLEQVFEHLALQLLHPRHRDVKEVAGAAGGIEHFGLGELRVERLDERARLVRFALVDQLPGGDAHPVPVGAQRLHDGRADQPLNIGARGVMRAELGPLLRIERAFEQGAEDRWLHLGPDMFAGLDQHFQLLRIERDRGAFLEQVAVELLQRHAQRGRKFALVHRRPQRGKLVFEMLRVRALVLQQGGEAAFGDQPAVFREHREQHAHQEAAGALRIVSALFDPARDRGEQIGNFARYPRGACGRIQALRIGPDRAEPFAHIRVAQILQHNPVARPIRELGIGLSGAGEIGIDLDAIADVRHQQERRPAMIHR